MRLDPVNGVREPQMTDLSKYLSKPEALVVGMVEDAYEGDAKYSLTLDGKVIGTSTETMTRAGGLPDLVTIPGPFTAGSHTLKVTFLNDFYEGSASTDRNLYVLGATLNNQTLSAPSTELLSSGNAATISFVAP